MWQLTPQDIKDVTSATTPHVHLFRGSPDELLLELKKSGLVPVMLECMKMSGKSGVMAEFAQKFNFPNHCGGNWDALWDCLTDPTVQTKWPCTVILKDGEALANMPQHLLRELFLILRDVAIQWAIPSENQESKAFNVIIQVGDEANSETFKIRLANYYGSALYWDTLNKIYNYKR